MVGGGGSQCVVVAHPGSGRVISAGGEVAIVEVVDASSAQVMGWPLLRWWPCHRHRWWGGHPCPC